MIALLVRAFRHLTTRLGRTAGVAVTAVTASSGLMAMPVAGVARPATSQTTPDTTPRAALQRATPKWSIDAAGGTTSLSLPALTTQIAVELTYPTAQAPDVAATARSSVIGSADGVVPHRMPGWLAAQAKRQAGLIGQTSRPLNRATARRPRPGNRPARRRAPPRQTAGRKVVWLSGR